MILLNQKLFNESISYINLLKAVSSLSNLFSDSVTPYLNYRVAENAFCKAFNAENLTRSDTAFDARIGGIGIGIKTFICHKKTKFEKVAEFNYFSKELRKLKEETLILKLSQLRNERIDFAKRLYNISNALYHCITRTEKKLVLFDTTYDFINIDKIKLLKENDSAIHFRDNINEYTFNFSKSTLFKKFIVPSNAKVINIKIIDDPFELLLSLLKKTEISFDKQLGIPGKDYVILPLYSLRLSKDDVKVVPEKSGLNQWNAAGRKRDEGELYIPIPSSIHNNFPEFFPPRDKYFSLWTPGNEKLTASVCQDNSKALMTNPNKALAEWLLRKVLKLKNKELLTYSKLKEIGVDSVIIYKLKSFEYKIDFSPLDSYETFAENMT